MDLHEIAEQIAGAGSAGLHLRQAVISAIASDGTLSVLVAGSTTAIDGIRAFSSCDPVDVGASVWLAVDGASIFAIGAIRPKPFLALYASGTQTIATATDADVVWTRSASSYADAGMFDAGSPTLVTIPTDGLYLAQLRIGYTANAAGIRRAHLVQQSPSVANLAVDIRPGSSHWYSPTYAETLCVLTAGTTLRAGAYQDSGWTLTILGDVYTGYLLKQISA